MATIVTLCEMCRREYSEMFTVKPVPGKTTTEKKNCCEKCKRKFGPFDLKQYLISGKGGR